MSLTSRQKKFLKGRAHALHPVAFLGQKGVTEAFLKEVDRGLNDHELIKVQIACSDQTELHELKESIMDQTKAELIQVIGHMMVLYRRSKLAKIKIPA